MFLEKVDLVLKYESNVIFQLKIVHFFIPIEFLLGNFFTKQVNSVSVLLKLLSSFHIPRLIELCFE
jgi:hypothetical protein